MMRWLRRILIGIGLILATIFAVRAWDSQRGEPLGEWQTFVPTELSAEALRTADWAAYVAAENAARAEVQSEVIARQDPKSCSLENRWCPRSPMFVGKLREDWNRSIILEPTGAPVGAAVFLHGLTDAPYSLRHIARAYQARGWVAILIRIPGHGTVPGGLTKVTTDQWRGATQLAMREARKRAGPGKPIHMVGYSNGGALAVDHTLLALADPALVRPDRLVLLSPAIGITGAARFAGLAGLPAIFPAFAKAAWLDLLPEYNPYKYNSFPVNAARQSFAMTVLIRDGMAARTADGTLKSMPPVIAFQSLVDSTITMPTLVTGLFAQLPANGSELVLFDMNRDTVFLPLLQPGAAPDLARLLPAAPRRFTYTLVTNEGEARAVIAKTTAAGARTPSATPLGLDWPREIYSVGHIAIPFPLDDGLYGTIPNPADPQGIQLGSLALRGERGVLVVPPDLLMRISANPFFPYMMQRIEAGIMPDA
jgi:alpha-beta hydrolase superfamily lysophospholipase